MASHPFDPVEYARLQAQRQASLAAFIEAEAQRIAALRPRELRQAALDAWKPGKPARIRERVQARVEALFEARR